MLHLVVGGGGVLARVGVWGLEGCTQFAGHGLISATPYSGCKMKRSWSVRGGGNFQLKGHLTSPIRFIPPIPRFTPVCSPLSENSGCDDSASSSTTEYVTLLYTYAINKGNYIRCVRIRVATRHVIYKYCTYMCTRAGWWITHFCGLYTNKKMGMWVWGAMYFCYKYMRALKTAIDWHSLWTRYAVGTPTAHWETAQKRFLSSLDAIHFYPDSRRLVTVILTVPIDCNFTMYVN